MNFGITLHLLNRILWFSLIRWITPPLFPASPWCHLTQTVFSLGNTGIWSMRDFISGGDAKYRGDAIFRVWHHLHIHWISLCRISAPKRLRRKQKNKFPIWFRNKRETKSLIKTLSHFFVCTMFLSFHLLVFGLFLQTILHCSHFLFSLHSHFTTVPLPSNHTRA